MMMKIQGLTTGYGKKQVLFGVDLHVPKGQVVGLIGPNGSGKSTVLKAAFGFLPTWEGNLVFRGNSHKGVAPSKNASKGIAFCPQGNRVFGGLSVRENLELGGHHLSTCELKDRIEDACKMFPVLRERMYQPAGQLSGGEQQMLAIARALIPNPDLLLLDEPSLGLSPKLVEQVFSKIQVVNREMGVTVLVVEQKVREVLKICQKVYSLKLGKVAFSGSPNELTDNSLRMRQLFL